MLDCIEKRLYDDLNAIRKIGGGGTEGKDHRGVNRLAYSATEDEAHKWLANELVKLGISPWVDAAGNTYGMLEGRGDSQVVIGSHLDSVYNGGNYDGGLGVVMALEAMRQLKDAPRSRQLRVVAWRGEESSRFNTSCIGSKLATGHVDFSSLASAKDKEGVSLHDAMRSSGLDPNGRMDSWDASRIAMYMEPHIEQADVLSKAGYAVGAVTAIRAPVRYKVVVHGEENHSGATPMRDRKDALVGASQMILGIHQLAHDYERQGYMTVATVGSINVTNGAITKIPGEVEFLLDLRGVTQGEIDSLDLAIHDDMLRAKRLYGTRFTRTQTEKGVPAKLYDADISLVEEAAKVAGVPIIRLVSGAGHDAQYVWNSGIPTSMVFVRNSGGSHNPNERIKLEDAVAGTKVLIESIKIADQRR